MQTFKLSSNISYFLQLSLIFLAYFFTARAGLTLDPVGGFATLVWPPSGIALAAVLIFGKKVLPAIFLGAFFVNFSMGANPMVAIGIGIGNTLEAFLATYILKRYFNFRNSLNRLSDVLGLIIVAAIFSTTIAASIGVLSLYLGNVVSFSNIGPTWLAWWVGDTLGNLIVTPLILSLFSKQKIKFIFSKALELTFAALFLVFFSTLIFTNIFGLDSENPPITYLVFPPLIWLSLRFGLKEVTLANFYLSFFAIIATTLKFGPFVRENLSSSLFHLQSFTGVVVSTSLIMSSVMTEKRELEERKNEFISMAAHEFRTPITTIFAFIQLLLTRSNFSKKSKNLEFLNSCDYQIKRLIRLVNNLLDLSNMQLGKFEIKKTSFLLSELIKETVNGVTSIQNKHQIILKGDYDIPVFGDRDGLEQVLQNLISNGIKYSPSQKKVVVNITKDSKFATLSVKDFGIGIPDELKNKIFDKFYRVSQDGTSSASGLGLGLYLSSIIVKEHGGKIWFDSKLKKGSTFYFTIPINK